MNGRVQCAGVRDVDPSNRCKCGNVQKAGRPCPTSVGALGNELTCVNATQHMRQPRPVARSRAVSLCNRSIIYTGRFRTVAAAGNSHFDVWMDW